MDINSLPGIGIKPLLSLKRHYRISIVAGVVVVLLGLPVVWIKGQSYYVAEAIFQVSPTYMKNLETDSELVLQSNSQYREYVNHLSNTVTRYDVLQRALNALKARGIDTRPPALTERKYIERLQKTVYVRAIMDTYMVRIGVEGRDKAHLDDLINAITASFLETTKAEQIYGSSERLNILQDNAAKLRAEIAAMETERILLGEKLGLRPGKGMQWRKSSAGRPRPPMTPSSASAKFRPISAAHCWKCASRIMACRRCATK